MAAIKKGVSKEPFDQAKFEAMIEPFTVRVEKIKGTQRMPIPMPESDDGTPAGTGWSKDNVRSIEQWLVTEWAGGGVYEITVTDSSSPPNVLKWSPYYDIREYPEIIPPPLREVANQQPVQPLQVVRPPMSAFPHGLPHGNPQQSMAQQPQNAYAPPQHYGYPYAPPQYQLPPPPPVGTQGWNAWRNEAEDRRREDELNRLREEKAQRDREALEARHKAELERVRSENAAAIAHNNQQMNELRTMIAQLTSTLTQQTQKPSENTEVTALRAQLEAQNRAAEAAQREGVFREMIRQNQEATQRQIEALMRQVEQQAVLARESSANRHDPLVAMMQEQARLNTDALKSIAQENTRAIERMQGFMMTPTAMFDFASRQSQQTDAVTEKLSKVFGTALDMNQRVLENAINLQPQGSGAIDLAREGIDKVTNLVERYTSNKSAEQRFAIDAQVRVAQAQAAAIAATQGIQQPIVHAPSASSGQLAGMPNVPNAQPQARPQTNGVHIDRGPERFGRYDDEWFGPLLPEVQQLRAGVARFIESANMRPPRMKDDTLDGISPEMVAMIVGQAIAQVMQRGAHIQAIDDLIFADRFADFVAVTLPDAPKEFQEDATNAIIKLAKSAEAQAQAFSGTMPTIFGGQPPANERVDGDGDDGADDDADDDHTEQPEQAPEVIPTPATPKAKPTIRRLH